MSMPFSTELPLPKPCPSPMIAAQKAAECQENVPVGCKEIGRCIPDAGDISFAESKSASDIAYDGEEGDEYEFPDGKKWRVSEVIENDESGFRSVVLLPVPPPEDDRVIYAFAGTDFTDIDGDVSTDFEQLEGRAIPAQYEQARLETERLNKKYPGRLRLTGHSLGGGLASYASSTNGCLPATGINSAPLNGVTLDRALADGCWYNMTNYNTEFDLVHNTFGEQIGNKVSVYGGWISGMLNVLGIPRHFLATAAPCVPPPIPTWEGPMTKAKREQYEKRIEDLKRSNLSEELRSSETRRRESEKRRLQGKFPIEY